MSGGYVDKYTGDQIMGYLGTEFAREFNPKSNIIRWRIIIKNSILLHSNSKVQKHYYRLICSIGINTGMVTTGKLKKREGDFTVYGILLI